MKGIKYTIWFFYNGAETDKNCLDSILNQINENTEVLIIDFSKDKRGADFLNNHINTPNDISIVSSFLESEILTILLNKSRGENIIFNIPSDFVFFNTTLKTVIEHHMRKGISDKESTYSYGSRLNGIMVSPKEICQDYLRFSEGEFRPVNNYFSGKIKFYFNVPLGRRNSLKPKLFDGSSGKEKQIKYMKDRTESKIRRDVLRRDFRISDKHIRHLIKLLFKEEFAVYYYQIEGIKKISMSTLVNCPYFYDSVSFRKLFETQHGCLLDLIYLKKPEEVDYQRGAVLTSPKMNKILLGLGEDKLLEMFSSDEEVKIAIFDRPEKIKSILFYKKDEERIRFVESVHDLFVELKRTYLGVNKDVNWIHSSGIVYSGKAHIFVGYSNSGKSTTAFRLHNAIEGTKFLSDDTCGLIIGNEAKVVGAPFPSNLRKKSHKFVKQEIKLLPKFKKGVVINKDTEHIINPVGISTFFFLKRTKSDYTKILDVDNDFLMIITKMHNDESHSMLHEADFYSLKLKYPSLKFKQVLLGKNIDALENYIRGIED